MKRGHYNPKHEIPLQLDSYQDIFSDFDARPYAKRALSEDFLSELKKASWDKEAGEMELKLLVPSAKRNLHDEAIIKGRLREHFGKHYTRIKKQIKQKVIIQGLIFTALGLALMAIATFMEFTYSQKTFYSSLSIIVMQPAGWFLFWEGLNLAIFESKKANPDLEFHDKMYRCRIKFISQ